MATSYPGNLDNFSNPSGTDYQNSVIIPHAEAHTNLNDAVEAIEAALGILPQGPFATVRARLEDIEADIAALGSSIVASLADNSVAGTKLQNLTVTEGKIADNSISGQKIKASAITSDKILPAAVSTDKIADDAVTYSKLANSSKVLLTRVANQVITATTSAYISWGTKPGSVDTDGFVSGLPNTTISIPTGKAGVYLIVATVAGFANNISDYVQVEVSTGSANFRDGVGGGSATCVAIADIAVGGTVKIAAFNGNASSMNATGRVMMIKLFDA